MTRVRRGFEAVEGGSSGPGWESRDVKLANQMFMTLRLFPSAGKRGRVKSVGRTTFKFQDES